MRRGVYATVPLESITSQVKRVDVEELYDPKRYQPKVTHQLGKPMFLY